VRTIIQPRPIVLLVAVFVVLDLAVDRDRPPDPGKSVGVVDAGVVVAVAQPLPQPAVERAVRQS